MKRRLKQRELASNMADKAAKSTAAMPDTSSGPSDTTPTETEFNFRHLCLICGESLDPEHKKISVITKDYVRERLLEIADRWDDSTSDNVTSRLRGVESLVSVGARYHVKCYQKFTVGPCPSSDPPQKMSHTNFTFQLVSDYIKASEKGKFTLSELREVMGEDCLSSPTLYKKLIETFGDDIHILQNRGSGTLIFYKCFSISKLCGDWYSDPKSLKKKQQQAIVDVAAELIRAEIDNYNFDDRNYQPAGNFLNNVENSVPPLLRGFLDKLIIAKAQNSNTDERFHVKRSAIAHSILSAIRPSFTSHLQIALAIYIHRKCGSRLIIDLLAKLGLCASYYQLQQYETSIIMDPPKLVVEPGVNIQHVFDNTDHNVGNLDRQRTYHCLGGIAVYTPEHNVAYEGGTKKIAQASSVTAEQLASLNTTRNVMYTTNSNGLQNIQFIDTNNLLVGDSVPLSTAYSTYLWAKYYQVPDIPSWKGFMEALTADCSYEVSKVVCLPFINEPPSDMTTINTALHKALADTRRLNQKTCFVTFDQPLYDKARNIVGASEGQLNEVVVRLGGFHLLVSYLGAIGYIMKGSGLEEAWKGAYASGSVKKMLDGHASSRAIRAHILTFTALGSVICREVEKETGKNYDTDVRSFLRNWSTEPPSLGDCNAQSKIVNMRTNFITQLDILKNRGPTAELWIQYFECVNIALQFIEAERLGNWKLHLGSVKKMLPIFHAAGHFNYAKSAQIYLQDMADLELKMTVEEFHRFTTDGYFTVRRTNKPWSGVWTDMTIEQTLNRFFGTDVKHGRGVTPSIITRYLSAMPSSFLIMECLKDYCGLKSSSSEQHVDLGDHPINRDNNDIKNLVYWFVEHRPFEPRAVLMSLSTGIVGIPVKTDCHRAIEKGKQAMSFMVGKTADKISIPATYRVGNLAAVKSPCDSKDQPSSAVAIEPNNTNNDDAMEIDHDLDFDFDLDFDEM